MRRRIFVQAAGVLGASALSSSLGVPLIGCTEVPPPAEPDPCNIQMVTLRIYADDIINPNENDRPRPVQVRLYQLANDLKMANAQYDDILLRDAKTLGDDLMSVNEVTVFPNDLVEVKFERIPEAFYLCGAAMFHDPQGQSWKTFYEFPPMPNTPEACRPGQEEGEPQAFPETAFFVVERKIDNGSQYDESMFPQATPIRTLNLPKRSAGSEGAATAPAK